MSNEWFPWYPARFRADTMHLSAEQDGIYRRLIDHYMETGLPLPDNEAALARIAGVSVDSWAIAAAMVRPFFKPKDGKLFNKKCDEVLSDKRARSTKNAQKGRAGAEKRWNSVVDNAEENSSSHQSGIAGELPGDATRQDKTGQDTKKEDGAASDGRAPPDPRISIIRAFDDARAEVFGEHERRPFPDPTDIVFAERFIATGATAPWLKALFLDRMSGMKRDGGKKPKSLKYFDDAVPEAYSAHLAAMSKPVAKSKARVELPHTPAYEGMTRDEIIAQKQRQNDRLQKLQQGKNA